MCGNEGFPEPDAKTSNSSSHNTSLDVCMFYYGRKEVNPLKIAASTHFVLDSFTKYSPLRFSVDTNDTLKKNGSSLITSRAQMITGGQNEFPFIEFKFSSAQLCSTCLFRFCSTRQVLVQCEKHIANSYYQAPVVSLLYSLRVTSVLVTATQTQRPKSVSQMTVATKRSSFPVSLLRM